MQHQQQPSSRVAAALASSKRGPPPVNLGIATAAGARAMASGGGSGAAGAFTPNNRGTANGPPGQYASNNAGQQQQPQQQSRQGSPVKQGSASFASQHQGMQGNTPNMRPLQLRSNPHQQAPIQMPRPAVHPSQQKPRIPVLQVTVPQGSDPRVNGNGSRSPYGNNGGFRPPTSPLARQAPPASPRAVFAQAPASPSAFSSSSDTLVGSPEKDGKAWSPNSSTSHGNKHLQITTDDLVADPENDRLMPATPARAGDFWKRFSTVVHENEHKDAMAEKVYGKKAGKTRGGARSKSEWLEKTVGGQRNYRLWVGFVAFLILAAIGGGLAYHFVSKKNSESDNTDVQPSTHDFGLGTDNTTTSQTAKDGIITSDKDAGGNDIVDTSSELPAPSAVAAGQSLRVRSPSEAVYTIDTQAFAAASQTTTVPVAAGKEHARRRRNAINKERAVADVE